MLLALTTAASLAIPATADQFVVTRLTDGFDGSCDNDCSLREAIAAANANPGADEVQLMTGTHVLTLGGTGEDLCATGDLDVGDDLEITVSDAATCIIDASGLSPVDRVMHVVAGTVLMSDLTIRGGDADDGTGDERGGGVLNESALTAVDCVIDLNQASFNGGGVYNQAGDVAMVGSTIADNTADQFGAGIRVSGGSLTMLRGTVTGNIAAIEGGGLDVNGYSHTPGEVTIRGGWFWANEAYDGGAVSVGSFGSIHAEDTTFVGNTGSRFGGAAFIDNTATCDRCLFKEKQRQ